jgi:hypothetical protein
MTYRERRTRRAERLRGWADKRQQTAAATLRQGERYRGDHAFNTQPGHIPERARLIAREDRAFRSLDKAASMDRRAEEIERQADRAIYNDDPDAIEQLRARIAGLEAQRERIKAANKAIRRHGLPRLIQPDPPFTLTDEEKRELLTLLRVTPYHQVETRGFPAYTLQNLGGNITRQRQRLARLLAEATPEPERPEAEPDATEAPEPSEATFADLAATLNQDAPPLADCPFGLTPPSSGPTAAQQPLWNGLPTAEPTPTTDAECPICEGTAIQAIQLAGGDHRIEPCDVCRGAGGLPSAEAAEIQKRLRDLDAEACALQGLPPCDR